jgi:translation initiation factor 1
MSKKRSIPAGGLVYSTDPGFTLPGTQKHAAATLPAGEQKIRIRLETKHRAGKAVTLLEGFRGNLADQEALGKKLKAYCGSGGSVKEGVIIIQGDNREKLLSWMLKNGYAATKKA